MQTSDTPTFGKIKTLPSGIVVENKPSQYQKYCWYIKGTIFYHNEDEPAVEYNNGDRYWIQHDKYHRLDGPAVEFASSQSYYIYGFCYSEEKYWNHHKVKEYKYLKEHPELKAFT